MSTTDEVVSDVVSKNKVQVFGRKKTATAVAICRRFSGDRKGSIRINGRPLELMEPKSLQLKILEPFLLLGESRTRPFDIRVRVNGGGTISRIYAIRQAIAKSIVAYCQKCSFPFPINSFIYSK
ncbi:hypothetical protein SNEBB_007202 [Seison nebaliae]|nr:hypothetical protein SNEBB_007202 [Seison nebaliae]